MTFELSACLIFLFFLVYGAIVFHSSVVVCVPLDCDMDSECSRTIPDDCSDLYSVMITILLQAEIPCLRVKRIKLLLFTQ